MPRSGNYQNELPLFNVLLVSISPAWRDQIASQSSLVVLNLPVSTDLDFGKLARNLSYNAHGNYLTGPDKVYCLHLQTARMEGTRPS